MLPVVRDFKFGKEWKWSCTRVVILSNPSSVLAALRHFRIELLCWAHVGEENCVNGCELSVNKCGLVIAENYKWLADGVLLWNSVQNMNNVNKLKVQTCGHTSLKWEVNYHSPGVFSKKHHWASDNITLHFRRIYLSLVDWSGDQRPANTVIENC